MANTENRGYPKPVSSNNISDDVALLQSAFDLVDGDIQTLFDGLAGSATIVHSHAISDVTGLSTVLNNKAASNHSHSFDDLNDVSGASGAATGYVLVKTASGWLPSSPAAAIGNHGHTISDVVSLEDVLQVKLDAPATPVALNMIRRNSGNTAYENRTPAEVLSDIGAQSSLGYTPINKAGDIMPGDLTLNANLQLGGRAISSWEDIPESGTFTVTVGGSISDPTTPQTTVGKYIKIGKMVSVFFNFNNIDTSGASGFIEIRGLPFITDSVATGSPMLYGLAATLNYTILYVGTGITKITMYSVQDNGAFAKNSIIAGPTKYLTGSLTYLTI